MKNIFKQEKPDNLLRKILCKYLQFYKLFKNKIKEELPPYNQ